MAPLRNSTAPDERRHQARHRLTSTVYVELGPGNGGIIVSLGTGGLSVHAAVKLKAEMELTLRFRLEPTEEPIEVAGRVAWLDPTHKEAGISFKDLSSDAERRIADWIAAQERPVSIAHHDISLQPKSPPMSGAEAPLSVRAPVPASLATETSENAQPSLSLGIPHRVISESSLNDFSSTPSGLQWTTSPSAALTFPTLEERFERPSDKLLRLPAKRYEALLEPAQPAPAAKEILPRDSGLPMPTLVPAPTKVAEVSRPAPRVDDSAALELRRRRKLGMAGATAAAGILALMMMVMIGSRPMGHGGSGRQSAQPVSTAAAADPESATQTTPEPAPDQSAEGEPSADDPTSAEADYDLLPILPTNQPATVPRDGEWGGHVEAMFGLEVPMKVNPAVLGLPVWTVQHSGYYYCVDNLNSETPQTGALMAQGEALQSGYQPKLGNYCH